MLLMFGVFWFILIRPQVKKQKEHAAMLQALQKGDMIITRGYNVYPRDIEEVFFQHPKVMEATAIGIPHAKRGEDDPITKWFVAEHEFSAFRDRGEAMIDVLIDKLDS